MKLLGIAVLVVAILAAFAMPQIFYFVNETDQVVITQFRRPIRTVTAPGLHIKVPFIQAVNRFEKRILRSDPGADGIPDPRQEARDREPRLALAHRRAAGVPRTHPHRRGSPVAAR